MTADILPQGVDADWLVQPGYNLMLHRRADGSWVVSYAHCNPRRRQKTIRAEGAELADCLAHLQAQITDRIWHEAERSRDATSEELRRGRQPRGGRKRQLRTDTGWVSTHV